MNLRTAFILLFCFISQNIVFAQEYPYSLKVKYFSSDSLTGLKKLEFQNYSELKDFYPGSFHFSGTTLPTPYSPVYRWSLFNTEKQFFNISAFNEIGARIALDFQDTLYSGIYEIELNGLWNTEEMKNVILEAQSNYKSTSITSFFWGTKNLTLPDDGLLINDLQTQAILNDSLSITSTVNKEIHGIIHGWILNVPRTRQITFQLTSLNDSLTLHYQTIRLKSGLYEIIFGESLLSGRYKFEIETYDAKLEQEFIYIK